ncbi:MAG: hypothetical protein ACKPKO_14990, partial [Candidatus Fonsibacter sp.]
PSAVYRLIDMSSAMSLNIIDIIVYWKNTFGNIHPFELHPGCSTHVKLMFRITDFKQKQLDIYFICEVYILCLRHSRKF